MKLSNALTYYPLIVRLIGNKYKQRDYLKTSLGYRLSQKLKFLEKGPNNVGQAIEQTPSLAIPYCMRRCELHHSNRTPMNEPSCTP